MPKNYEDPSSPPDITAPAPASASQRIPASPGFPVAQIESDLSVNYALSSLYTAGPQLSHPLSPAPDTSKTPNSPLYGRSPSGQSPLNNREHFPGSTDFNIIRAKTELPQLGWRKTISKMGIPLKKSSKELIYDKQVQKINKFLRKPVIIGILSFKGGVGKTTISVCTGSTFADLRALGGSVVGLDMDNFGSMASRVSPNYPIHNIKTFLADAHLHGPSDTTAHQLSNTHRFHILASDPNPTSITLGGDEYNHILNFLLRDNCIVFVDADTSAANPALPAIVHSLHALIIVSSAAVDGAAGAWQILAWLNHYGFHNLLNRTILVVNRTSADKKIKIDLKKLEKRFSIEQHIPVFHVPYDSHLSEAGVINLSLLQSSVRRIFVDIAASISDKLPD